MSRAKEIREKQELQAKLSLAFSKKKQTVLSWLGEDKDENEEATIADNKNEFLNLQVVSTGSILNLSENSGPSTQGSLNNKTEIGTIGEFLKSDKKVSALTKKRNNNKPGALRDQFSAHKSDNKATLAFKNKMRDSARKQLRTSSSGDTKQRNKQDESDSDDEKPSHGRGSAKKANNLPLQFGKKKTKK